MIRTSVRNKEGGEQDWMSLMYSFLCETYIIQLTGSACETSNFSTVAMYLIRTSVRYKHVFRREVSRTGA